MTYIRQNPIRVLFSWLLLILASTSNAEESKTLIYVHPEIPVLTLIDENRRVYDPITRTMAETFKKAGLMWQDSPAPISRMYQYLQNNPEYFSILVKTPYINKCCITSEKPAFHLELRAYRRAETPKITNIQSLAGKKIITIRGYSYGNTKEFLSNKTNRIEHQPASTHQSAFAMLRAGRANYFLSYRGPQKNFNGKIPNISIEYDVIEVLDLYLIFNKEYPNAENIIRTLEETYHELNLPYRQ